MQKDVYNQKNLDSIFNSTLSGKDLKEKLMRENFGANRFSFINGQSLEDSGIGMTFQVSDQNFCAYNA